MEGKRMELGTFSVSLTVKDLDASRSFYEKLGFGVIGGDDSHNYLILANGQTVIGLFHGMFDDNILTFNPGLDSRGEKLDEFTDVREIASGLREAGIEFETNADESDGGPAHITLFDPDGNPILIDQHV
jgi:catechol 2,3-dioxygenase-like lactoylglutathione lyase family enzyme